MLLAQDFVSELSASKLIPKELKLSGANTCGTYKRQGATAEELLCWNATAWVIHCPPALDTGITINKSSWLMESRVMN